MVGGPQRKRTRHSFLDIKEAALAIFDLSLATMLALEQVSVINVLKGSKGMQEERKISQEMVVQP